MVYSTKKRILFVVILATVFSFLILYFLIIHPRSLSARQISVDNSDIVIPIVENSKAEPTVTATAKVVGLPIRLKIPKLNINVVIEQVGLTAKGAMDTPKDFSNAGWFSPGTRPGEIGSAVITGHFGKIDGKALLFNNLSKLVAGDKVEINNDQGETLMFTVTNSQSLDPNAKTSEIFNSRDGKSHLNLVTCEGIWNPNTKSYSKRLVVFADQD